MVTIRDLSDVEINSVSGGASVDPGWRVVPPSLWERWYPGFDYPDNPPSYQDENDPESWVAND